MHIGCWWESQKERDCRDVQEMCEWIILRLILVSWKQVVWTVTEDMDQWNVPLSTIMNIQVP
jgi:hypothetical protein